MAASQEPYMAYTIYPSPSPVEGRRGRMGGGENEEMCAGGEGVRRIYIIQKKLLNITSHFLKYFPFPQGPCGLVAKGMASGVRFPGF